MIRKGFFIAFLWLASCGQKIPSGILPPDKMKSVLYDYLSADVYVYEILSADSTISEDEENARLQLKIFQKHHTTRDQFYRSYRYYVEHPEQMREVIDSLAAIKPGKSSKKQKSFSIKPLKEYE